MLFLTRMLMRSRHMASPTIVLITDRTDLDDQLSAPTLCPVYWANRTDIKAELQMDLILILADHDYPPVPQDDVFKEIFEQAENFKKYEKAECEDKADDSEELARQFSLITAYTVSEASEA